jgi:hypothetical protein
MFHTFHTKGHDLGFLRDVSVALIKEWREWKSKWEMTDRVMNIRFELVAWLASHFLLAFFLGGEDNDECSGPLLELVACYEVTLALLLGLDDPRGISSMLRSFVLVSLLEG